MGLTARPSSPALAAVARSLESHRDRLIAHWADWLFHRTSYANVVSRSLVERQLGQIIDIIIEMAGPLRRQAAELWFNACDTYGRSAAARGLAAGEVVEELQHLRELLIRDLSEVIAALPARQSMAAVLRLNRMLDKGIAHAVVGYTDVLVEMLLNKRGVALSASEPGESELEAQIDEIAEELSVLQEKSAFNGG